MISFATCVNCGCVFGSVSNKSIRGRSCSGECFIMFSLEFQRRRRLRRLRRARFTRALAAQEEEHAALIATAISRLDENEEAGHAAGSPSPLRCSSPPVCPPSSPDFDFPSDSDSEGFVTVDEQSLECAAAKKVSKVSETGDFTTNSESSIRADPFFEECPVSTASPRRVSLTRSMLAAACPSSSANAASSARLRLSTEAAR